MKHLTKTIVIAMILGSGIRTVHTMYTQRSKHTACSKIWQVLTSCCHCKKRLPQAPARELRQDFFEAIGRNDVETVNALLAQGASPNGYYYWLTPLIEAAQYGHIEVTETLLAHKANINAVDHGQACTTDNQCTALMWAAKRGHLPLVKTLLMHGADVNIQSDFWRTALTLAIEEKHTEIALLLLTCPSIKVNVRAQSFNGTALITAVLTGNMVIVDALLARPEIDVNTTGFFENKTALYHAVDSGNVPIMQALLAHPKIDLTIPCNTPEALRECVNRRGGDVAALDALLAMHEPAMAPKVP